MSPFDRHGNCNSVGVRDLHEATEQRWVKKHVLKLQKMNAECPGIIGRRLFYKHNSDWVADLKPGDCVSVQAASSEIT